jgi:hypothetical protein
MYQEEAICNREIYKNAEINVLKLNHYNYINRKPRLQNNCAKNIGAHNMHKWILKYTQILAVINQAKLIAK